MVSFLFILSIFFSSCSKSNIVDTAKNESKIDSLIMPPNITVKINREKIGVILTSYTWNVYKNDEKGYSECVDGPLKSFEKYYTNKVSPKSSLTIESEYQPNHATVQLVDGSKFCEFNKESNSFTLPGEKGTYLVSIDCKWNTKGQAIYIFKIKVN